MIVSAHDGYPRWVSAGADFIEVDVRRNAEGVFILAHDEPRPGASHPTLDEVFKATDGKVKVQLDLKEDGYEIELMATCPLDRIVITTGNLESIERIKAVYPQVTAGLTRQFAEETTTDFLALDHRHATDEALDFCASHGIAVWLWTVDDRKLIERCINDPRVAGLITNRPELALKLRTARR